MSISKTVLAVLLSLSASSAFARSIECSSERDADFTEYTIEAKVTKNKLTNVNVSAAVFDERGHQDDSLGLVENATLVRDDDYSPRSKKYEGFSKFEGDAGSDSHSTAILEILLPEELPADGEDFLAYARMTEEHAGLTMNIEVSCRLFRGNSHPISAPTAGTRGGMRPETPRSTRR
jgi:hypothetical protein